MSENPLDTDRIRQYVDRHIKKARRARQFIFLGVNFGLFILFNLIAGIVAFTSAPFNEQMVGALIMLSVGWMVGLIMHLVAVYAESDAGRRRLRQRLALKAMQEALGQSALEALEAQEKRKRDQIVELSDDGELVPVEEKETEQARQSQSKP